MKKLLILAGLLLTILLIGTSTYLVLAGGPVLDRPHPSDPSKSHPNPGTAIANLAVANMHPQENVYVQAQYYSFDRVAESVSEEATLGPLGRSYLFAPPSGLYADWHGLVDLLVVDPDDPLAIATQVEWSGGSAGHGPTAVGFLAGDPGATTLYFPFVSYIPGQQYTRLIILSIGDRETQGGQDTPLVFEYYQDDGSLSAVIDTSSLTGWPTPIPTAISATPVATPEGNVQLLRRDQAKIFDTRVPGTMMPSWAGTDTSWGGSLKVSSPNGQPIAGVAIVHWSDKGQAAYNALTESVSTSYVPSLERRDGNPMLGYSVIRIQCLAAVGDGDGDGKADCDVQVELIPNYGSQQLTLTCYIAQNATKGVNTKAHQSDHCGGSTITESPWIGSAKVATTDGSRIGVIAMTIREASARAHASSGASSANAGTTVYAPDVYKHGTCGGSWVQWSIISVQNIDSTLAANVSLHFLGRQLPGGTQLADLDIGNIQIQPEEVYRLNTKNHCDDFDLDRHLGDDWEGSVRVVSDVPVAVVVETLWPDKLSAYNGVPYP